MPILVLCLNSQCRLLSNQTDSGQLAAKACEGPPVDGEGAEAVDTGVGAGAGAGGGGEFGGTPSNATPRVLGGGGGGGGVGVAPV